MQEPAAPPPDPRQELQKLWLEACKSCQHGDLNSIRRFFDSGGAPRSCYIVFLWCFPASCLTATDRREDTDKLVMAWADLNSSRRLLGSEARELSRDTPDCFCEGETLANLALKWDNMAALTLVLEAAENKQDGGIREEETGCDSVREGKKEAGSSRDQTWEMRDAGAACSEEGCLSKENGRRCAQESSMHLHGVRDSAYRHAGFSAHETEMGIPYIAADNGAARRENATRLGMQVSQAGSVRRIRVLD